MKSEKNTTLGQQQSYRRIPIAWEKGLTALVVELCEDHFRHFPDDQFALIWYAMGKIELSQYAQAEKALRRSIALLKTDDKKVRSRGVRLASVQMGHLFREKSELKKASFWYRRGLRADSKYGDAYIYLGSIAFDCGFLDQAEQFYRKAINASAESIDEAYFNLGSVLVAKGRYEEAIKCYRKAIEIDPKYAIAKKRMKDALLALQLKKS